MSTFKLAALSFDEPALEPHQSADALRTRHDKHHAAYIKTPTRCWGKAAMSRSRSSRQCAAPPGTKNQNSFNQVAQAWNHGGFWPRLSPEPQGAR
jgi:superoxide dismutase